MLELVLAKYKVERWSKSQILITIENSDLDRCYKVSEELEMMGLRFHGWMKDGPETFSLIMS